MINIILCVFLIILIILILDEFFLKDRRAEKMVKNIPGLLRFPLIGSTYKFICHKPAVCRDLFLNFYKFNKHILKFHVGARLILLIHKPEYAQTIFNSKDMLERNYVIKWMKVGVGEGLLTASVGPWKHQRKNVMPLFNQTVINKFVPIISENCDILVETLKRDLPNKNNGEVTDMLKYTINFAADSLCEAYLECKMGFQQTTSDELYNFIESALSIFATKSMKIYNHFDTVFNLVNPFKHDRELLKYLDDIIEKILNNKMKIFKRTESVTDKSKKSLMDVLIESNLQGKISRTLLVDELKSLFVAGIDTNAVSLCFILLLLGMHPAVQEELYKEIMDVLGPDRRVELTDLSNLKYTERVIKESLRIFPTIPVSPREATEDVRLDSDIVIPKGATAMLSIIGIHRSEEYWPDPLKFDPDRFLSENSLNRHPCSWLPFSAGSRNCIGLRYAMTVLKTALPMIVRAFRVKTCYEKIDDVKLENHISAKPTHGFGLTLESREFQ